MKKVTDAKGEVKYIGKQGTYKGLDYQFFGYAPEEAFMFLETYKFGCKVQPNETKANAKNFNAWYDLFDEIDTLYGEY